MKRISYIFFRPNGATDAPFSLSPDHSDTFENQTILNSLVGTLVKSGPSGRFEPYLAQSWSRSEDGLTWQFQLKKNLVCEDGTSITASKYASKLESQLKAYSKKSKVIAFNQLKGWTEFVDGGSSSLSGLRSDDRNRITFEFAHEPENLLNYLRMVYFGFWCDGNFQNGEFRKDGSFVSSAAFRVKKEQDNGTLTIERNLAWAPATNSEVDEVQFSVKHISSSIGQSQRTIVRLGYSIPRLIDRDNFFSIRTVPTLLTVAMLSPATESRFFEEARNRAVFQSRLAAFDFDKATQDDGLQRAKTFYSSSEAKYAEPKATSESYGPLKGVLKVNLASPPGTAAGDEIQKIADVVFAGIPKDKIEFEYFSVSDPVIFKRMISNQYYDLRISSVDVGAQITNSVIDMMFCTKMGVSFPDPNNQVCHLTQKYKAQNRSADEAYVKEFDQTLLSEGYIHPLFRSGLNILYSKDFDPASIPSGSDHPRFEDFKFTK